MHEISLGKCKIVCSERGVERESLFSFRTVHSAQQSQRFQQVRKNYRSHLCLEYLKKDILTEKQKWVSQLGLRIKLNQLLLRTLRVFISCKVELRYDMRSRQIFSNCEI